MGDEMEEGEVNADEDDDGVVVEVFECKGMEIGAVDKVLAVDDDDAGGCGGTLLIAPPFAFVADDEFRLLADEAESSSCCAESDEELTFNESSDFGVFAISEADDGNDDDEPVFVDCDAAGCFGPNFSRTVCSSFS